MEDEQKRCSIFFISEVENGLMEALDTGSKIKAGAIKIAFTGGLKGQYRILTEAAVDASLLTGAPLIVHTERGLGVEKLVRFFEKKEISFSKIMLCIMDEIADIEFHKLLADKSIYLEYDTFMRSKYNPDKNVWPLLIKMAREGYSRSVTIGSDLSSNSSWKTINREKGLAGFFKNIVERLISFDIDTADIENIIKKMHKIFHVLIEILLKGVL